MVGVHSVYRGPTSPRLGRQRQLNATPPLLVLPANFLFLFTMTMMKRMTKKKMMLMMMMMMMTMKKVMQRRGQEGLGRITVLGTL